MSQKFSQIKVISSQVKFFCHIKTLFLVSNVTLTNESHIVREAVIVGCQNDLHQELRAFHFHNNLSFPAVSVPLCSCAAQPLCEWGMYPAGTLAGGSKVSPLFSVGISLNDGLFLVLLP